MCEWKLELNLGGFDFSINIQCKGFIGFEKAGLELRNMNPTHACLIELINFILYCRFSSSSLTSYRIGHDELSGLITYLRCSISTAPI